MKKIDIARIAHQANKAYCEALGDMSQMNWEDAPDWQRDSALAEVEFTLNYPGAPPSANHDSWLAQKVADSWVWGPVKDPKKKEHPCCVPYADLPEAERGKDYLFRGVVDALKLFRED
jgi:hypothetical protein